MDGETRTLRLAAPDPRHALRLAEGQPEPQPIDHPRTLGAVPLGEQALLVVAPDGIIEFCSAPARRLLNANGSDPVGRKLAQLMPTLPMRAGTPGCSLAVLSFDFPCGTWYPIAIADGCGYTTHLEASYLVVPVGADSRILVALRAAPAGASAEADFERFVASVDACAEAVVVTTRDGVVEYVNPAYERLSGWRSADVVGRMRARGEYTHAFPGARRHRGRKPGDSIRAEQTRGGWPLYLDEQVRPFTDRQGQVTHFVSIGRDVSSRIHAERILQRRANFDNLTEIPNRHLLLERLHQEVARAAREHGTLAVICADLDRLKAINDRHGHAVGDIALRTVASRLQCCVRDMDTVGRFGGDEFLLIVPGLHKPKDVDTLLSKLVASVRGLNFGLDRPVEVTLSVGAVTYPDDGHDAASLISAADSAMYRAKRAGGDRHWSRRSEPPSLAPALSDAPKVTFLRVRPPFPSAQTRAIVKAGNGGPEQDGQP